MCQRHFHSCRGASQAWTRRPAVGTAQRARRESRTLPGQVNGARASSQGHTRERTARAHTGREPQARQEKAQATPPSTLHGLAPHTGPNQHHSPHNRPPMKECQQARFSPNQEPRCQDGTQASHVIHKPKSHAEGPVRGGRPPGGYQVTRVQPLKDGTGALGKAPRGFLHLHPPFHHMSTQASPQQIRQSLDLGLPAFRTVRNKSVVFKLLGLWYFVIAAQNEYDRREFLT